MQLGSDRAGDRPGRAHLLGENRAPRKRRQVDDTRVIMPPIARPSAGDASFEFLIYHADDGSCYANRGVNG